MQGSEPPNASPPYAPLLETAYGALRAQILCVAAELGLAERLAQNGPATAGELAPKLGVDAAVLERVLRGLVSMNVCDEIEGSRFRLTALVNICGRTILIRWKPGFFFTAKSFTGCGASWPRLCGPERVGVSSPWGCRLMSTSSRSRSSACSSIGRWRVKGHSGIAPPSKPTILGNSPRWSMLVAATAR